MNPTSLLTTGLSALAFVPEGLRTVVVHCLTGPDNKTFDISRVLLLATSLTFLGLSIYHCYLTRTFDAASFGMGSGAVLGGGAAGVRVKATTEPPYMPAPVLIQGVPDDGPMQPRF